MTKVTIKSKCQYCDGKGKITECDCNGIGRYGSWECVMGYCDGKEVSRPCPRCEGRGYLPEEAELYED